MLYYISKAVYLKHIYPQALTVGQSIYTNVFRIYFFPHLSSVYKFLPYPSCERPLLPLEDHVHASLTGITNAQNKAYIPSTYKNMHCTVYILAHNLSSTPPPPPPANSWFGWGHQFQIWFISSPVQSVQTEI